MIEVTCSDGVCEWNLTIGQCGLMLRRESLPQARAKVFGPPHLPEIEGKGPSGSTVSHILEQVAWHAYRA